MCGTCGHRDRILQPAASVPCFRSGSAAQSTSALRANQGCGLGRSDSGRHQCREDPRIQARRRLYLQGCSLRRIYFRCKLLHAAKWSREPGTKVDRGIAVTVAVSKANVYRLTIRREFAGGRLREFVAVIPSRLEVAPQGSKSLGIADPLDGLRVETKRFIDRQSG